MGSITIRQLPDGVKMRLRVRAARNGRSMEEEAREILKQALSLGKSGEGNLAGRIRKRIAPLGGVELPRLPREPMREPPDLGS